MNSLPILISLTLGLIVELWLIFFPDSRLGKSFGNFINKYVQEASNESETFKKIVDFLVGNPEQEVSYQTRTKQLIEKFSELSSETDKTIHELQTDLNSKVAMISELSDQQKELMSKIEDIKKTPEFVTLQIQAKLDKMDMEQNKDSRKGVLRDYLLYALGVVTPYIINFIITKYFSVPSSVP